MPRHETPTALNGGLLSVNQGFLTAPLKQMWDRHIHGINILQCSPELAPLRYRRFGRRG